MPKPRYIVTHTNHSDDTTTWYVKDTRLIPDDFNLYIVARCSTQHDANLVCDALNAQEQRAGAGEQMPRE